MLRQAQNLTQIILRGSILNRNILNRGIYSFCSENEPPKGFEKFKRKPKSKNQEEDLEDIQQEAHSGKQEIIQGQKQKKQEKTKDDDHKIDDEVDQRKKYNHDPNSFKKSGSESKSNHKDPEDHKEKDHENHQKKKKEDLNFDPVDTRRRRLAILAALAGAGFILYQVGEWQSTITYTEFIRNYLDKDQVRSIQIQREGATSNIVANIFTVDFDNVRMVLGNVDHFLESLEKAQQERGKSLDQYIPIEFKQGVDANNGIDRTINLLYLGISLTIAYVLLKSLRQTMNMGKGGSGDMFGSGKSVVKQFGFEQQVKVKFKDVAGLDEGKFEIKEFVDFLKKPKKYKDIGATIPRGALLSGPPGTGKTMLAKACAGEAGVPFFYVSGSDFVEMFVGVGASRVRELFKMAKSKSPSIIFIDEIDAVGRKRESRVGGNDERDNTLNQLLVEMDGFGTDHNVVVLAATNRRELLDPALTRPGRFDRSIDITLPDIGGRKQIFLVHLKPLKLDTSRDVDEYANRLATLTPGFSGAEIANLCNEAAILAARKNKTTIDSHDFEMAAERVMAGLEKKRVISEEERKIVAYHESGHAVVSWFLEGGNPLLKMTIIPRSKGSLGYAQYLPNESSLETREELIDRICCILGGRISELHFFGQITTGAYDDLKKAYQTASAIVTKFGMSDVIGYVGYQNSEYSKQYSDATQKVQFYDIFKKIDEEIKEIIDFCTQKVKKLIKDHHQDVENLSQSLLLKETLDLHGIIDILGERPFPSKSNYKMYLELKKIEKIEKEQEKQEGKDSQGGASTEKQEEQKQENLAQ